MATIWFSIKCVKYRVREDRSIDAHTVYVARLTKENDMWLLENNKHSKTMMITEKLHIG